MSSTDYPSFRFGPEGASVVVHSPEEDSLLDESWSDIPTEEFDPVKAPTVSSVHLIERAFVVEKSPEQEKRKPGRPKKVE